MTSRHSTETFDALVTLAQTIRPGWHTAGVRQAIRDSLARPHQPTIAELAYAVVRCAENPTVVAPAVIAMDGPHWRQADEEHGPRIAIKRRCPECHGLHAPEAPHIVRGDHQARAAEARANIRRALEDLCPCGIPPNLCNVHRPEPAEETADA